MLCPGCGAETPDAAELRTDHLYVGASPGCWAAYMELLGWQLSDPALAEERQLSVDVYMAQHPGVEGRQASQSVWVHLVGLCLSLDHDFDGLHSARAKARLAAPGALFPWLEPPQSFGSLTVLDVLAKRSAKDHRVAVQRWAQTVWDAWRTHRAVVRKRAAGLLRPGS